MLTIEQYQAMICKYNNLKTKLNDIISSLGSSSDSLADLKFNIGTRYQIDDNESAIAIRTNTLNNNIADTINYLINNVLPAIDSAINTCNSNINYLKEEQRRREAERRRQEEEERKKLAAKRKTINKSKYGR